MSPDASAYRTLGLQPGADAAAVEAAYRRLIKLHHPDREGGDSKRAAEINRAYRHLRDARRLAVPPQGTGSAPPRQRRARRGIGGWLALATGVGLLVLIVGALDPQDLSRPFPAVGEPLRHEASRAAASRTRAMRFSEMPLDSDSIDRAQKLGGWPAKAILPSWRVAAAPATQPCAAIPH